MSSLLLVWFTIQAVSFIFFPLSRRLFPSLPDQGYLLNKSLSLIVFAYTTWLIISFHLLPFTQVSILIVGLSLTLTVLSLRHRHTRPTPWRHYLITEVIFFSLFIFFAYLKYKTPAINGTEKPMDFALINGIFRSTFFPPHDAWYAGESINYYYFGHYLIAFIAKLTAIPTRVIYNLALPLVFALTGLNITSLITNSAKPNKSVYLIALAAIILVLLGSNLDTSLQLIKSLFSHIPFVINWWNPSRIIPNTITEFPYFSLLLGDVHAHVLALVLGSLFLCLCQAYSQKPTNIILIAGTLVLASLAMTNPWEIPGYILLVILLVSFTHHLLLGTVCLLIFSTPFLLHFQLILPVNDPKPFISLISHAASIGRHTSLGEFFSIWGTHLVILTSVIIIFRKKIISKANIFPLALCATSLFLLLFSEFFFINDFFLPPLERMNTVFKLYYQSWLILGVGIAIFISSYFSLIFKNKVLMFVVATFFLGNLSYFFFATPVRLKDFVKSDAGLDGLKYLSATNPSDLGIINWLNNNVSGSINIVESAADPSGGTSYTAVGRISAATGLPTVIGWSAINHEGGWRNNNPDVTQRILDVQTIYQSANSQLVKNLLNKYSIKYIIVGEQERLSYPESNLTKIKKLGRLVYTSGSASIYQTY